MKLKNIEQVNDFLAAADKARGSVILKSCMPGNEMVIDLKSKLSQYVAIGALLGDHGEYFELFCSDREDEELFFKFFFEHPEV